MRQYYLYAFYGGRTAAIGAYMSQRMALQVRAKEVSKWHDRGIEYSLQTAKRAVTAEYEELKHAAAQS